MKSTVVRYSSWHTEAGAGRMSRRVTGEREEMGDGRAEGLSTVGDGGQAAVSLMPDDGMHICTFGSLQREGLYVGDLMKASYGRDFIFCTLPITTF